MTARDPGGPLPCRFLPTLSDASLEGMFDRSARLQGSVDRFLRRHETARASWDGHRSRHLGRPHVDRPKGKTALLLLTAVTDRMMAGPASNRCGVAAASSRAARLVFMLAGGGPPCGGKLRESLPGESRHRLTLCLFARPAWCTIDSRYHGEALAHF